MRWQQVVIQTSKEKAEEIADWFMDHDAVSVTFSDAADQALFEQDRGSLSLWQRVDLILLFEFETPLAPIFTAFKKDFPDDSSQTFTSTPLADQDWQRVWMEQFKPLQFGQRLWVCPSWLPVPDSHAVNILLDPGMAFGTGTHPTTRLMLEYLESYPDLYALDVMDYGCGSGILAIAALKLGCRHAFAVDNDPLALESTRENANRNQVTRDQLSVYLPDEVPNVFVDILLANILAEPLKFLASTLATLVKENGKIVLSGILPEQVDSVVAAYLPYLRDIKIHIADGWACVAGIRKN